MQSMADILKKAGVITEDQATVAEKLKADVSEVQSELRYLQHRRRPTPDNRERQRVLESRLRILQRTRVVG